MLQDDNMPVDDGPADDGDGAPRQSYNFAPGYHGIVYRADVPDWGAGPRRETKAKAKAMDKEKDKEDAASHADEETEAAGQAEQQKNKKKKNTSDSGESEVHYKLQSMKWGLIPFWTKRNPDYAAVMKTINCRDDSLAQTGGMWSSMKGRKRCVVVAQGFYEWLKSGKEKVPHFVKRKDGKLMCFAGLWDCVQYEGEPQLRQVWACVSNNSADLDGKDTEDKHYTYTIITTDSNKQLKFLHDRMPVILDPASDKMKTWLDPGRFEWSKDLQDLLKPFDGELEMYPVSKDVGKVGNNSPTFIIPIASRENKSNIANFFANAQAKTNRDSSKTAVEVQENVSPSAGTERMATDDLVEGVGDGGMGVTSAAGLKRKVDHGDTGDGERPLKREAVSLSPSQVKMTSSPNKAAAKTTKTISSTSNGTKSTAKGAKSSRTPKITKFFGNSA